MNLAVFLAIGESWEDFERKGQDRLFLHNNLHFYSQSFDRVWVYSYGQKGGLLLPNVELIPNQWHIHRFLYALLIPFIHWRTLARASVLRGYQLTGVLPGTLAKLLFRKPLVINYGYNYPAMATIEGSPVKAFLFQHLTKLLLPAADRVIVTTEALEKQVADTQSKVSLIPNSVDTDVFIPKKLTKTIDLLYVGRITKQKNLPFLLEVLATISNHQNLKVIFIGEASDSHLQEDLLQMARQQSISLTILPAVPHEKLVDFYNRTRIVVLPSFLEGHPKVLLEAMSCQAAVVGMDVPGIRNVITHRQNGLLLSPQKLAWRRCINSLLKSKALRRRLGEAARRKILAKYDSRKTWGNEISLLKNIV